MRARPSRRRDERVDLGRVEPRRPARRRAAPRAKARSARGNRRSRSASAPSSVARRRSSPCSLGQDARRARSHARAPGTTRRGRASAPAPSTGARAEIVVEADDADGFGLGDVERLGDQRRPPRRRCSRTRFCKVVQDRQHRAGFTAPRLDQPARPRSSDPKPSATPPRRSPTRASDIVVDFLCGPNANRTL